jgi:predicted transcriptional regulator
VVTFSFRGPKSLRTRLRIYSTRVDRPAQDIAVDAIREYLDRHER